LILSLLDLDALGAALQVSKEWTRAVLDAEVWYLLIKRDFRLSRLAVRVKIDELLQEEAAENEGTNIRPLKSGPELYLHFVAHKLLLNKHFEEQHERLENGKYDQFAVYRNIAAHLIGVCFRGELDALKKAVPDPSSDDYATFVKEELNAFRFYEAWVYFGNYSSPHEGGIFDYSDLFAIRIVSNAPWRDAMLYGVHESTEIAPATLLHYAVLGGHLEVVKYLCSLPGIEPELRLEEIPCKPSAWDIATRNGHFDIADFLLEKYPNLDKQIRK